MKTLSVKEKWLCFFVAVVMALCLAPLVGMIFAPTTQTTENKPLAKMPCLTDENGVNEQYLSQLGEYYTDHFALRQQLVSLDSAIRGRVFGVSTVDSVVVGKENWLFYSDTVSDYTGSDPMTERQLFNIANNMAITQRYVSDHGAKFIFTIAPNKNTLYPEYMPYTLMAADEKEHNAVRLAEYLEKMDVNYTDLFALFSSQEEVLYLKRDSHWSNDGALLAANRLLSDAGREDAIYTNPERTVNENYIGDLNRMLYPKNALPETNAQYTLDGFAVTNGARAADDPVIITSASDMPGSLLMYRDSFGNTLYPFMAQAYGAASFVRTVPYDLGTDMDIYQPDTVIIEKVERSIDELAAVSPVLETPDAWLNVAGEKETLSTISVCRPHGNAALWRVDGAVEEGVADKYSRIFLRITLEDGKSFFREAFTVSDDSGDWGYRLYLSDDAVYGADALMEIIASVNGQMTVVAADTVALKNPVQDYGE